MRKALFAFGNPPLAWQGFARFICCVKLVHISLFVLELIVDGWRGDLTGLAAIQALMPICVSSFMSELASSCVIFQTVLHMVFSFTLPPLIMRLYRVNIIRGGILMYMPKIVVRLARIFYFFFKLSEAYYLTSLVGGTQSLGHWLVFLNSSAICKFLQDWKVLRAHILVTLQSHTLHISLEKYNDLSQFLKLCKVWKKQVLKTDIVCLYQIQRAF